MESLTKHDSRLLVATILLAEGVISSGPAGAAAMSAIQKAVKDPRISSMLDMAMAMLSQSVVDSDIPQKPDAARFRTNMSRLAALARLLVGAEGKGTALAFSPEPQSFDHEPKE